MLLQLCLIQGLSVLGSWSRVQDTAPKPSGRSVHVALFDDATNLWIHGGSDGAFTLDLWSFDFDTGTWDRKQLNGAPSARGDHVAVWDPDGYALWVHGGYDGTNYFDDLWRYSGYTWTNLATPGPSPRSQHVAVWDATNLAIWIHGGTNHCTLNQDLWKFDTQMSTWSRMPEGQYQPFARANHVAVWDDGRRAMWIHAGYNRTCGELRGGLQQDLWRYDTTTNGWDLIAIGGPSARAYHVAGWDPNDQSIWIHGGFDGAAFCRDLWRFDLENYGWQLVADNAGPSQRFNHAGAWDSTRRSFCVHGGYSVGTLQDDLWCYVVTTTTTSQTKSSTTTSSITTSTTSTSTASSTTTFSRSHTSTTFTTITTSTSLTLSTSVTSSSTSSHTITISTSTGSSTSSTTMSATTTSSSTQTTTSHTTTTTSTSSATVSLTTTTSSISTTSATTSSTRSTSSTTISTSITTSSTVTTTSSTFSTSTASSTSISTTTTTSHTRTSTSTSSTSTTWSATTTSSLSTTSSTTSSSSITVTSSSSISSTRTTSTSFTFTTSSITRSLTSTTSTTVTSTSRTLSSSTSSTKTSSSSTRTTSSQTKTSSTSSTATMTTSTSSTTTTTTTSLEDLTAVYILCPLMGFAIVALLILSLLHSRMNCKARRIVVLPVPADTPCDAYGAPCVPPSPFAAPPPPCVQPPNPPAAPPPPILLATAPSELIPPVGPLPPVASLAAPSNPELELTVPELCLTVCVSGLEVCISIPPEQTGTSWMSWTSTPCIEKIEKSPGRSGSPAPPRVELLAAPSTPRQPRDTQQAPELKLSTSKVLQLISGPIRRLQNDGAPKSRHRKVLPASASLSSLALLPDLRKCEKNPGQPEQNPLVQRTLWTCSATSAATIMITIPCNVQRPSLFLKEMPAVTQTRARLPAPTVQQPGLPIRIVGGSQSKGRRMPLQEPGVVRPKAAKPCEGMKPSDLSRSICIQILLPRAMHVTRMLPSQPKAVTASYEALAILALSTPAKLTCPRSVCRPRQPLLVQPPPVLETPTTNPSPTSCITLPPPSAPAWWSRPQRPTRHYRP